LLFSVGTRVKFLHSSDEGIITAWLGDGMVMVLIDGENMEIPTFEDDLIPADATTGAAPAQGPNPEQAGQSMGSPPAPPPEGLAGQRIYLAFSPVLHPEGRVEHYDVLLINDTPHEFIFTFVLRLRTSTPTPLNGKLAARSSQPAGRLLFDQLNDAPLVDMTCWRITTAGTGPAQSRELRIRPKSFFKRLATAPLLHRQVHLFSLIEKVDAPPAPRAAGEDLRSYTKRHLPSRPSGDWDDLYLRLPNDILAYAQFLPECDLHIEQLAEDHHKLSNAEILRLQINTFETYLDQAINLGVERVFIIHGIGTGRLRNAIATRLKHRQEVKDFKNEYHPRYGWGATEVIFE